jgi:acyl carrier protein
MDLPPLEDLLVLLNEIVLDEARIEGMGPDESAQVRVTATTKLAEIDSIDISEWVFAISEEYGIDVDEALFGDFAIGWLDGDGEATGADEGSTHSGTASLESDTGERQAGVALADGDKTVADLYSEIRVWVSENGALIRNDG